MSGSDEELHLAAIEGTFSELNSWRTTVESGFEPVPGSELALDDEDWPPWPLSQLATASIGMAFDHLDAIRHTVETRHFFPMAQVTLVRGGLIGAAQGVWLLAPADRGVRLHRARALAAYIYKEHGKYLSAVELSGAYLPEIEEVAAHWRLREGELAEKRDQLGERADFNTTQMIIDAARSVLLPEYALDTEVIWRQGSGAAHGLPWSVLGHPRSQQTSEPDESGLASFAVVGGASRVANAFLCVVQLMRQGWGLRAMRGAH